MGHTFVCVEIGCRATGSRQEDHFGSTLGNAGPRPPLPATRREANPNSPAQAEPVSAGLSLRRRAPSARVGRPTWSWASLPSVYTLGSGEGRLRPPSNPRLPRRCRSTGRTGASPRTPESARAHRAAARRYGRPRPAREPGRLRPGGVPPAPHRRGTCPRGAVARCPRPHRGPTRRPGPSPAVVCNRLGDSWSSRVAVTQQMVSL